MQSPYAEQVEAQVWEYLNDGDVHQAIATCERLNREFPNFASGWHTASQLALKLGNTPMALDAIREARRMDSENTTWALQEAQCLWRLGRAAEVRACVDHLLTCELQTAYELSGLGSLLANVGDRRKALEYYKQAAALQPDDARHRFNIASLQRTLGDLDEAESNFDQVLRLNPSDFEAWKLRSELRTQTHERNHIEEHKRCAWQSEHLLRAGEGAGGPGRSRPFVCILAARRQSAPQTDAIQPGPGSRNDCSDTEDILCGLPCRGHSGTRQCGADLRARHAQDRHNARRTYSCESHGRLRGG